MQLEPIDATIYDNEWFTFSFKLLQPDKVTPVNLTGYTALLEIKPVSTCSEPILSVGIGSGISIDLATGEISVVVNNAQLRESGVIGGADFIHRYRLSLIAPSGQPKVYRNGKLKVLC
jgi:hypothetical protein